MFKKDKLQKQFYVGLLELLKALSRSYIWNLNFSKKSIRHVQENWPKFLSSFKKYLKNKILKFLLLCFLLLVELERFGSSNTQKSLSLAFTTFKFEGDLLGDLGLLLEDWLLLTSKSLLLVVVSSSSLGKERLFSFLVLSNLMFGVTLTFVRAVGSSGFLKSDHRL